MPLIIGAGLATGVAVTAIVHKDEIEQLFSSIVQDIKHKHSRRLAHEQHFEMSDNTLDNDFHGNNQNAKSDYGSAFNEDNSEDDGGDLTPTTSRSSTPFPLYASGRPDHPGTMRNRHHNDNNWEDQAREFQSHSRTTDFSLYDNDDDDLYDMPSDAISLNSVRPPDSTEQRVLQNKLSQERQLQEIIHREQMLLTMQRRSLLRSESLASRLAQTSVHQQGSSSTPINVITSSSRNVPEMEQLSSPVAQMFYSQNSSPAAHSRRSSFSSNQDFLEYERRLMDRGQGFHKLNPTISTRHPESSGSDSQSTRSSNYPSLSFSPNYVHESDGSWQGLSSIASELATPSESDVSTLDCESVIYTTEGENSDGSSQRLVSHHSLHNHHA